MKKRALNKKVLEPVIVWRKRVRLIIVGLAIMVAALVVRAVELQVLQNDFLLGQGNQRQHRSVAIPAHRGMIVDRRGEPMAISTPVDSVWAEPEQFITAQKQWGKLSRLLGIDHDNLSSKLAAAADREFVYLKRHVTPELGKEVAELKIPGVHLQREYRRYYPSGEVAGHILGFTNIDDHGQEGLELAYDDWLAGKPGRTRIVQDRLGRAIQQLQILRTAEPGRDLVLSIDKRLQYLAYRELKSAVFEHQARSGSLVILDVETGEVLAMVNQPTFNPNNRQRENRGAFRNRAVTDVFEPGSTMKPFTVAAALVAGKVKPGLIINTAPGYLKIGKHTVRDKRNLGMLSITDIIRKSSNVGASMLALSLPAKDLWQVFHDSGFGEHTGSAFPGEVGGLLSAPNRWHEIEQATLAYGYGISLTTLQLARAYAAIAADGVLPEISFQKRELPNRGSRVMPAETARILRGMLETVVDEGGTATRAGIPGYRVAGKTGTSKKSIVGGYSEDRYISVFAGMVPASQPKLVAVVVIDDPSGEQYYGGLVAAPVFSAVLGGALRLLDIEPDDPDYLLANVEPGAAG